MKHILACGRNGRVEQSSHKKWRNYWVILKYYELNLYQCDEKDVGSIDLYNPNIVIKLEGCLAQAVPELVKLENVFGVSTQIGDAFYFQVCACFCSSCPRLRAWPDRGSCLDIGSLKDLVKPGSQVFVRMVLMSFGSTGGIVVVQVSLTTVTRGADGTVVVYVSLTTVIRGAGGTVVVHVSLTTVTRGAGGIVVVQVSLTTVIRGAGGTVVVQVSFTSVTRGAGGTVVVHVSLTTVTRGAGGTVVVHVSLTTV